MSGVRRRKRCNAKRIGARPSRLPPVPTEAATLSMSPVATVVHWVSEAVSLPTLALDDRGPRCDVAAIEIVHRFRDA